MDVQDTRDMRQALTRIQSDYNEMPELKLTERQARRLWNLPEGLCGAALTALVAAGYLVRARDGAFLRRHDRPIPIDVVQALITTN